MQTGVILFSVYSAGTQLSVFYCSSECSHWAKTDLSPVIFQLVIADRMHQLSIKLTFLHFLTTSFVWGTVRWQKADWCCDCRLAEIYFFNASARKSEFVRPLALNYLNHVKRVGKDA